MLHGKCPRCGTLYHGWSLRWPRNQSCPNCGVGLEIRENGGKVFTGYSPFNAEKYTIDSPTNSPPTIKKKDSPTQKE